MISEGGERRALGGVPREQKMLKGHLPRVIYHRVYSNIRNKKTLSAGTKQGVFLGEKSPCTKLSSTGGICGRMAGLLAASGRSFEEEFLLPPHAASIRKQNAFAAVLSTEGRVVGLCWAN